MARVSKTRKPQAAPETPLEALMLDHLRDLAVRNYSAHTVRNRQVHIGFFLDWCRERGLTDPVEITRPVLERYQRHLFHYRKKNGEPLSFRSQHSCLVPLRVWFRWMTRQNHILHNPASELELPRLGRSLPKNIFSAREVECVFEVCDIEEPIGLRDRAILEVLYSTGLRRMEMIALKLYDLALDRGLVLVRQGKGHKDRYVPIGERAIAWLQKYVREARPQLAIEPDDMTVFLTAQGEPFSRDHLSFTVKERVDSAKLGKTGSCHLFRHTMATLMHENGADIRHIQALLGHEDIKTTQIYTQVAIRTLQKVHAATHPAATFERDGEPPQKRDDSAAEALSRMLAEDAAGDREDQAATEDKTGGLDDD
jgi:integrase/recombinase XerD